MWYEQAYRRHKDSQTPVFTILQKYWKKKDSNKKQN